MSEQPPISQTPKSPTELANVISSSTTETTTNKVDVQAVVDEEEQKVNKAQLQELRAKQLENDRLQANIDKIRGDNRSRIIFSILVFLVTVVWMACILCVVIRTGQGKLKLSDTILVTLITTTTLNVFGFFLVIVNYLFNKDKST